MNLSLKALAGAGLGLLMSFSAHAMTPVSAMDRDLSAEEWVQDLANRATDLLGDSETTPEDVVDEFQTLLVDNAALRNFGRSALGAYSRTITEDEFELYIDLLEQYGTSVVRGRFAEYSGQTILVTGSSIDVRENFAYVSVQSDVLDGYDDVLASVRWLLIRRGEDYRVYDITVETTDESATFSLLQTQREEFNSILTSNGGRFEALFDYLRDRIREAGMEPAG